MRNLIATEHKPDKFDLDCEKVLDSMDGLSMKESIDVLEQVLDYLRMAEADARTEYKI